jgi:aldehyde:ferredoxin oxidoreductase
VEAGPYAGTEVEGPEYETLCAFGSLCGNSNLGSIVKANEVCDKLGMDTITAGNVLAFAMECYQSGVITGKHSDDTRLTFGNHEAMINTLEKIARREELGNILAEGVKKAADIIGKGAERYAVHVKGLEPPGFDPRGLRGMALAYAVSCRGACHLRHLAYRPNLTGSLPFRDGKIDRLSCEGQAEMVNEQENFYSLIDCMGLCKFVSLPAVGPILWRELKMLYLIVTGVEVSLIDLISIAKRVNDLVRSFNIAEQIGRADDSLPQRFINKPLRNGASKGQIISRKELEGMLDEYYELKGWDRCGKSQATGYHTK